MVLTLGAFGIVLCFLQRWLFERTSGVFGWTGHVGERGIGPVLETALAFWS